MRPPRPVGFVALCHDVGEGGFPFDFRNTGNEMLRRVLAQPRL